jgi:hypothetical protein
MSLIVTAAQILAAIEANGGEPDSSTPDSQPDCGTHAGRSLHQRRGETLCQDCRDYYNAYRRERQAARMRDRRRVAA